MQYENPSEDKFFEARGVKPPERTANITEQERDKVMESNRQRHHCSWRQRGPEIFCDTDDFEHGKRIGTHLHLVGTTPEGLPMLKPFDITKL